MSADTPTRIAELLDQAVHELVKAQHEVDQLQLVTEAGCPAWHQLRSIGDHIHNALGKLGD